MKYIIYWNESSEGSRFDFGMTFMAEKPIVLINRDKIKKTPHKSFQNVLLELDARYSRIREVREGKKEKDFDYFVSGHPFYVGATILKYSNSIEEAQEIAIELHKHRNCFSQSFMSQLSYALNKMKKNPSLKEIPDLYKITKEYKELVRRLKGIPIPFEYVPEIIV